MGIEYIQIRNFKSIKKIDYDISRGGINCLLGKNGVGKTTIDRAIKYFYEMASNPYSIEEVIDKRNPYIQKMSIELGFDLSTVCHENRNNEYLDSELGILKKYLNGNKLSLKLVQYRNGSTKWFPENNRFLIMKVLKIFPVYMIQTRLIDSKAWNNLWDVVADIAITSAKADRDEVREKLRDGFTEIYGNKYAKVLENIEQVLESEKISINDAQFKKRFKHALLTNIGGEDFMLDDQNFDYYSDGINTYKYLSLYLRLLAELSELSRKEILIVLDEPEISLHLQYVEELADVILNASKKVKIIISTHSTRLICSLHRGASENIQIVTSQLYLKNGYSYISGIQDIVSDKDKYLIRDNEAESYFANALVFVEGQTEIQILQNRNIVNLFPKLKKITVYNTKSNDSATKIIIPDYSKPTIPFLVLIDMDKILDYNLAKGTFNTKKKGNATVNPFCNDCVKEKEKYYYGKKRRNTYDRRVEIEKAVKSRNYICDDKNYYLKKPWLDNIIDQIKKYCRQYRTIPMKTTIEGAIVCEESLEVFLEWLKDSGKYEDYLSTIRGMPKLQQVSLTRILFHGKLDCIPNSEDFSLILSSADKDLIEKNKRGDKVDGWIFCFFDWYFNKYIIGTEDENLKVFSNNFPELFEVLQYIENMIN